MTIIEILLALGLCHFIRELGRFRKRQWLTTWVDFSNDAFGKLPRWQDALGFLVIIAVPLLGLLMINQVLVSTGLAVLAEACAFAERAGIDAAKIPQALAGGRADSRQLQEMFPKMVASDFSITGRAALMVKDLELIHDLACHVGAPMPVTAGVTESFRKMVADGWGDRDNTEMVNFYRGSKT